MKYVPGKRPARMIPTVLATRGKFTGHDFPGFDYKSISSLLGQLWKRGLLRRVCQCRPGRYGAAAIYRVAK